MENFGHISATEIFGKNLLSALCLKSLPSFGEVAPQSYIQAAELHLRVVRARRAVQQRIAKNILEILPVLHALPWIQIFWTEF